MLFFLLLWTGGTYAMWLRAHITMQKRGRHQVAGEHKAVVELAAAMQSQLNSDKSHSTDLAANLTEEQYERHIAETRGGTISYKVSLLSTGEGDCGWGVKEYLNKEKWWLAILVAFAVGSIVAGVYGLLPYMICIVGIAVALIVTMSMGSTGRSRAIIMWWSIWGLAVMPQLIAIVALINTKAGRGGLLRYSKGAY